MTNPAQLEEDEKYLEAYEAYKKEYNHNTKNIDLIEKLGHLALILDKKDEAEEFYLKLLQIDNTRVVAYEQLIDIYRETDPYKYYVYRGNLNVLEEHLSYAAGNFKKAIEKASEDKEIVPVRFVLADIYEKLGKNDNAIDEYLRLTDIEGINESAFIKLAQLYLKTDFLQGAIDTLELCRKRVLEDNRIETEEMLAKLYVRNSQPEEAIKLTKDELTKVRCLMDMGENEKAFEILRDKKESYSKESKYYSLLAQYYYQVKNYDEAFDAVEKFAELDSNSPLIYQMRAMIYETKGDYFNEHLNWAKYNILRGNRDIALNEYMSAYNINSEDANLLDTIADFLYNDNDKTKASEFYEKLLMIEPENKKSLRRLAEFRENIGDTRGMIEYLEALQKLEPRDEVIKEKLETAYKKFEMGQSPIEFFKKLFSR